jgi:hypothetical protein
MFFCENAAFFIKHSEDFFPQTPPYLSTPAQTHSVFWLDYTAGRGICIYEVSFA